MELRKAIENVYRFRSGNVEVKKKPHIKAEHTQGRNENDQNDYSTGGTKNARKY